MKQELIQAIKEYLNIAYPHSNIPENVNSILDEIQKCKKEDDIFNSCFFEPKSNNVYALRLGNEFYPHMKLSIKKDNDKLFFLVDTHDSKARIPENVPGYERFVKVINKNRELKSSIMERLDKLNCYGISNNMQCECRETNRRVLVVDDEDYIRDILMRLLECLDLEVVTSSSVEEAEQIVRKQKIDFCFLDIMMPVKSGYEFIKYLEDNNLRNFPIVFVTGMDERGIKKELADGFILKPFTLKDIKLTLEKFKLLTV
jgi:CheY-like chemotaxis protein